MKKHFIKTTTCETYYSHIFNDYIVSTIRLSFCNRYLSNKFFISTDDISKVTCKRCLKAYENLKKDNYKN